MIKIHLYENHKAAMPKIRKFMDHELIWNCDLSGASYKILLHPDFTYIDGVRDEIIGAKLMSNITNIIDEERGLCL